MFRNSLCIDAQRFRRDPVHPRAFISAVVLSGVAPLFGFTAIALGLVGYATALFKLSRVLTILWVQFFLGETNIRQRLAGALLVSGCTSVQEDVRSQGF